MIAVKAILDGELEDFGARASARRQLNEPENFQVRAEDRARQTRDGYWSGERAAIAVRVRARWVERKQDKGGVYM